jgi:hypothetical protein
MVDAVANHLKLEDMNLRSLLFSKTRGAEPSARGAEHMSLHVLQEGLRKKQSEGIPPPLALALTPLWDRMKHGMRSL